jgi:MFS family permease
MRGLRTLLGISIFWLALSLLADGFTTLVLPAHLLHIAGEAGQATTLGLLTFVGLLAGMLVQPIAGLWSDRLRPRWGRRGPLTLGALLILVALGLFGLTGSVAAVLLVFVLMHVAAAIAQAAQQGFIPDLAPGARRGTAAGLKSLMDTGGALLGFVVLGQALGEGRIDGALLVVGAVVVAALALTIVLTPEEGPLAAPAVCRVALADALRLDVRRHRAFAWLVLSRFLFLLGVYAVGRFFLFFVADRLGLEPGQAARAAGALLAGLTLITVLAAVPAGWLADRLGRWPLMLAGAGLSGVGALLLIAAGSQWQILLFGGLMALGSAAFAAANWAATADAVPPAEAARFMGLANIGTAGAMATAGLLGPLVDRANAARPGAGYTLLFLAASLAYAASALALRPLRARPPRPMPAPLED